MSMKKTGLTSVSALAMVAVLSACGGNADENNAANNINENNDTADNNVEENVEDNNEDDENNENNGENNELNDEAAGDEDDVKVIAHRGASGYAPEQTEPALDKAIEMDADWLELDIQKTADDELVAFHDDEIDRTTDGEGEIGDHTLEELKELDAGSWFNEEYPDKANDDFEGAEILALDEIFEMYGSEQNYYIETKSTYLNEDMEEPMVDLVEEHGFDDEGNVIIQSFHQDSLQEIHEINPDIPLVQLLWWEVDEETGEMEEWLEITEAPDEMTDEHFEEIAEYADGIGPHLEYYDGTEVIDEDFVQTALDHDFMFHVYTINEEEDMERLIDWGVTGLFTDFPDRLHEVLDNR
ncbi:glycerophosphodiester phosphodiesterase [Salisediminibacterium halotolerans]|uniref:glycerophosphodiester phosphodiesterase n=1 Tax=Salisediminibacterium halotolerans TaxID=517425 RepID=UPI000F12931A|nr:glycerophosphodiester phosphodiesterase [Salisediminibacterium halotolerans]RLJ69701.1 glycerophosphoryl diester phosphodiesterase [Actinophytocola xinjiangensis]RPE89759.1 glycerophosphoryl diester phosphodiesterase [Salisediminibacterium halotolerans]TWG32595.1 glycerophosphoryl diester phosphodiesterase [Salisediminibacterium halotolerans]GEL08970.1 glycerophosphoryl diester phosphodiesterase [Salisediminibacterium halotolerans]